MTGFLQNQHSQKFYRHCLLNPLMSPQNTKWKLTDRQHEATADGLHVGWHGRVKHAPQPHGLCEQIPAQLCHLFNIGSVK